MTLTTTDLDNGKTDLDNWSTVVNSETETETTTRFGDTVKTRKGLTDEFEAAIAAVGANSVGNYEDDPTITNINDVVWYETGTVYYKLKEGVSRPYDIDSTTYPDPEDDPNIQQYIQRDQVTSIAALQARGTETGYSVYLSLGGRSGWFKTYLAADYVDEIAIDTEEGMYILSNDTDYVWIRQKEGLLNPRMFGSAGNGIELDTVGIQTIINLGFTVDLSDARYSYAVDFLDCIEGTTIIGKAPIIKHPSSTTTQLIRIPTGADNVSLHKLNLDYENGMLREDAILTETSEGEVVSNLTINGCMINGSIGLSRCDNARVTGNTITNGAIYVYDWYGDLNVNDNFIKHDSDYGADGPYNGIGANCLDDLDSYPRGTAIITRNIIECYRMGFEWRDRNGSSTGTDNETLSKFNNNSIKILGSYESSFGVSLNSSGWTISDNTIKRDEYRVANGQYGIEVTKSSNNIVTKNTVVGFKEGVAIYSVDSATSSDNNVVANNMFKECTNSILIFYYAKNNDIHDNNITVPDIADTVIGISVGLSTRNADKTFAEVAELNSVHHNTINITSDNISTNSHAIYNIAAISTKIDNNIVELNTSVEINAIYDAEGLYTEIKCNETKNEQEGISQGVVVFQNSPSGLVITGNRNINLSKGIDLVGSVSYVNILVANNQPVNCSNDDQFFPNSYMIELNGLKQTVQQFTSPSRGTWEVGDLAFNSTGGTGWKCSVAGTNGSLTSRTVSTISGSEDVSFDSLEHLEVGQYIDITGVTGTKQIKSINWITGDATVDSVCDATVADASFDFSGATFTSMAI